jgi:hypothetical protein
MCGWQLWPVLKERFVEELKNIIAVYLEAEIRTGIIPHGCV